jgi:hypothetical protein
MKTPEPEAEIGAVVAALSREQEEALLGAVKCKDGWYTNFGKPARSRILAINGKLTPLGLRVRHHLTAQSKEA